MNDIKFPLSIRFLIFQLNRYHHTDSRSGARTHFLALMLEGTAEIVSAERTLNLCPGDVFYIPMGLSYQSYWHGNDAVRWASLAFSGFPNPDEASFLLQKIDADEACRNAILELSAAPVDCISVGRLFTLFGGLMPRMETERRSADRILFDTASAFMRMHPHASIADIAKACSVSESGLYAAFRKSGTTPIRRKQQLQIEHAVTLLSTTDLTIDIVAEQSGFSSSAYFLRVLRKFTGMSTREIRKSVVLQ